MTVVSWWRTIRSKRSIRVCLMFYGEIWTRVNAMSCPNPGCQMEIAQFPFCELLFAMMSKAIRNFEQNYTDELSHSPDFYVELNLDNKTATARLPECSYDAGSATNTSTDRKNVWLQYYYRSSSTMLTICIQYLRIQDIIQKCKTMPCNTLILDFANIYIFVKNLQLYEDCIEHPGTQKINWSKNIIWHRIR